MVTAAEKVASETPALPGDVIVEDDGCRYLVRWAELQHKTVRAPCGCCSDDDYDYNVYIDEPWDGPSAVILSGGGGTALIMPLKKWWGAWPPEKATVYRDGQAIYPKTSAEVIHEMDLTLEPNEMNP